jgi:hypothetical protein
MTEPARAKTIIVIDIERDDAPKRHIRTKMRMTGSEPQVPGAIGSRPRPKQDVRKRFIQIQGIRNCRLSNVDCRFPISKFQISDVPV